MKLMKFGHIILTIVLIFFSDKSVIFGHTESELKTNYEIFDSLSTAFTKDLFQQTVLNKYSVIHFSTTKIPAASLFEREFANLCIENNIVLINDTAKPLTHNIHINRFELQYTNYVPNNDSLVRIVFLDAHITGADTKYQNYLKFAYKYSDTLSRDDISLIQSNSAQYVNGAVPEKKKSFYERALEPAIFVSAAILSVVLFFSVRTSNNK